MISLSSFSLYFLMQGMQAESEFLRDDGNTGWKKHRSLKYWMEGYMPNKHIELLDNQWKQQQHNSKPSILLSLTYLDSLFQLTLHNREERCYHNKIWNMWHGFGSPETKNKKTHRCFLTLTRCQKALFMYYKNIP